MSLNPKDRKKVKEDVEQVDELAPLAALAPLAGKLVAAGGAKVAAAGGAKALAGKAAGSLAKQAAAEKAVSTVMGGGKKKEQVAASHELNPDDLIQELKDSGLFSEEELNSILEDMKKGYVKILSNAKRISFVDEQSQELEGDRMMYDLKAKSWVLFKKDNQNDKIEINKRVKTILKTLKKNKDE